PTAVAVAAGEVDFAILDYMSVRPLVERGNIRLLAVTEPKRSALMPDLPTSGEQGITREIDGVTPWFMLVAPPSTPESVVSLLNKHLNEVLQSRSVQEALLAVGIEAAGGSPEAALAYFQEQRELSSRVVREMKLSLKN